MVDFLRIQGIPAPVENDSASIEIEEVGEVTRAEDGTLVRDRVDVKRTWSLSLVLQHPTSANAWADLILGRRSQVWSFDTHLYSSKGVAVTLGGGGSPGQVQTPFISGGSLSVTASSTVVLTDNYAYTTGFGWSVSFWWFNGTVWQHIYEDSTNSKYVNGTYVGTRTFCTPGATSITLTNPDASTRYLDDFCVNQFVWPTTWPAGVASYVKAMGPFPRMNVEGLMVDNNFRRLLVVGEVTGIDFAQGYLNGTWFANLERVKLKLSEV